MKNTSKVFSIALVAVFVFSAATCFGQSGGQTINSPEALKTYLDSQPANGPDKPISVSMTINDLMFEKVVDVIKKADKYVSLNITGNALKTIPDLAFLVDINAEKGCETLVSITMPNSVTSIGANAFRGCTSLNSVTIPNSVASIGGSAFSDCTSLTSITIPKCVTNISTAFYTCTGLTSVTFQGTITPNNIHWNSFNGGLRDKYIAGGIGTYTRPNGNSSAWRKQ